MTLTDFLLARIAEDEAVARSLTYNWSDPQESLRRRFIADVEAKRRIVEEHDRHRGECDRDYQFGDQPCETLRALASVYSDHPDYREEWKP